MSTPTNEPVKANLNWRQKNPERARAQAAEYREQNRDSIRKNKREWYQKNRERLLLRCKVWRDNNVEKRRRSSLKWKRGNPEKIKADNLKKSFFSLELYRSRFEEQQGKCAICKTAPLKLHADHDHETLMPRGLLCPQCNVALGLLKDSITSLEAAIKYLNTYRYEHLRAN